MSNSSEPIKILVAGDVEGQFGELFARVSTVNKKNGPFAMLLCVGNFYPTGAGAEVALAPAVPPAPIPTFVLGPNTTDQIKFYPDLTGCEISSNVTYLGKSGVYTESSGLRIAYLSGIQSDSDSGSNSKNPLKLDHEFNSDDIQNLHVRHQSQSQFPGVDILLTSVWPAGVSQHSTTPVPPPDILNSASASSSSPLISQLAVLIKPRYHFAGLQGIHWERPPYRNHKVLAEAVQHTTRFIGLAKVNNKAKKKWLYAFSIVPMKHLEKSELIKAPGDTTECPYSEKIFQTKTGAGVRGSDSAGADAEQQFFYDMSARNDGSGRKRRGGGRGTGDQQHQPKKPAQPTKPCWFCLGSPEVETHLVVSIGDSAYLTLAKGGLTPDHVLILPIGHFGSMIECPPEVVEEITKFKSALRKMFLSHNQGVVFFERNYKSPHLQIQVVPVPVSIIPTLKSNCLDFAEANEIELQTMPSNAELFQMTRAGWPYFYMELPDGLKLFCNIHHPKKGQGQGQSQGFDVQFGRELMASPPILNLPDRVDWRNCKMDKDEETKLTGDFRKLFEPFDFTLGSGGTGAGD